MQRHRREVSHGLGAGVEMLVLRSKGHPKAATLVPLVFDAVDDTETFTFHDVDGFFAVLVLAGMPARADLRDYVLGAPSGKAVLGGSQQRRPGILVGFDPLQFLFMDHCPGHFFVGVALVPEPQPRLIEIGHVAPS